MMTIRQFYLLKLAEECAEVAQRATKQIQFGRNESQAKGPSTTKIEATNAERLRDEVVDFLAIRDILIEMGEIPVMDPLELDTAKMAKRIKVARYLEYSQSLGQVEDWNQVPSREPEYDTQHEWLFGWARPNFEPQNKT
jgi:NTP pyrophosphatase (non-canonical NTP hydrolase)